MMLTGANENTTPETADTVAKPSLLAELELFNTLQQWFRIDRDHSAEWRRQAKLDFDLPAGRQWSDQDKAHLESQGRVPVTFNRALPIIKSIAGIEINGRSETSFIPRTQVPGVVRTNEILSAASKQMADDCDAEDEQSEAFQDAITVGMGWTEGRLDYDEDPAGKYIEEKVDPLEMYWDRSSRKKNLADARRLARVKKMTLAEARELAESMGIDYVDEDLNATWAIGDSLDPDKQKSYEEKLKRDDENASLDPKSDVYLVHMQWMEKENYFKVLDPASGQAVEVNKQQKEHLVQMAKQSGANVQVVPMRRNVYKQALLGNKLLGTVKSTVTGTGFTYSCITGERDRNAGTWFGIVRSIRDPQMWANKWLSQTMHILNSTAKGGILAEKGAFSNWREAQDTYAQPDAITEVADGALEKGKIMPKPGQGFAQGHIQLTEFAISSIRDVTGVNLELLGLRDANQPGILEAQRKQAAMTILATLFDSLRRFRKNVGRIRLALIQQYFSDGRLVRITGDNNDIQYIPLLRDKTAGDYEIIVDDAPSSPNEKERIWGILQGMMPVLAPFAANPQVALTILEYSPLPTAVVNAFKDIAAQSQGQAAQDQKQKQQLDNAGAAAKINKDNSSAKRDDAEAMRAHTHMVLEILQHAGVLPRGHQQMIAGVQ